MNTTYVYRKGLLNIGTTAALSVMVLVGVVGWKVTEMMHTKNTSLSVVATASTASNEHTLSDNSLVSTSTTSYDPAHVTDTLTTALATTYTTLKRNGTYTPERSAQLAEQIGSSIDVPITYKIFGVTDIKTDNDISYARMLTYREALQKSFEPLMRNKNPEINLLRAYVENKDPSALIALGDASKNYKLAYTKTAQVIPPIDAITEHLGVLNALSQFTATLDQLVAHADDSLAEAALLNSYMQAQQNMFTSFNDLYKYYKSKHV